jgi:mRNA-degrading endonuclease RelE of RelBE toxin-antitoxin system
MEPVPVVVVETDVFRRRVERLLTDWERDTLREFLSRNPEAGVVVPGLGGIRKLRWAQQRTGKGKRGGVRIIYCYVLPADTVLLLEIYAKTQKEDLTHEEKKKLRQAAEQLKRIFR